MRFHFKNILLIAFCSFVFTSTKAQYVDIDTYNTINTHLDSITYFGNSEQMFRPLFSKFRSMILEGNRQINIVHIGDDYVKADIMTERIRKNLQSFMHGLEGSRGIVAPLLKEGSNDYKLGFSTGWKSANVLSSSDRSGQGLCLSSVYTNHNGESIQINVNNKNSVKYDFNSFRIYHSELYNGDRIKIEDMNVAYQTVSHKEEGYTEFILSDYVSSIKIVVNKKSREDFHIYGFWFQNQNPGVVYNSIGLDGLRADYINRNANLFVSQLKDIEPDFIVLSLGQSDLTAEVEANRFEADLEKLVNKIRQSDSNIPILIITPVETWFQKKKINSDIVQYLHAVNSVAQRTNCAVFDMYGVMGGNNSAKKLQSSSLMQNDLIHLTTKGYQLVGDLLYNAIWKEVETKSSY